jgi:hypothetical protein
MNMYANTELWKGLTGPKQTLSLGSQEKGMSYSTGALEPACSVS